VSHFKHSEQTCRRLRECQQSCDLSTHHLIQDVETRWNSTYLMLQRISEQQKALNLYSVEQGSFIMLTKTELETVDNIVSVLKPFYDATLEISRDDACISLIIPIVSLLIAKLQSSTEDIGLSQMKAALRDSLNRRFSNVKAEPNLIAATLLDPGFKSMYFSAQEKEDAKKVIQSFLRRLQWQQTDASADAGSLDEQISQPSTSSGASSSLWDDYDNHVETDQPTPVASDTESVDTELDNYLRQPRVSRSSNIYAYWQLAL